MQEKAIEDFWLLTERENVCKVAFRRSRLAAGKTVTWENEYRTVEDGFTHLLEPNEATMMKMTGIFLSNERLPNLW